MFIDTQRFGRIEIDGSRIIRFIEGPLGFPGRRRFALLQTSPDPVFFWLQCVDDPYLAFVVCDPRAFVPDYEIGVRPDDVEPLQLRDPDDCQVLVIVNRVGDDLTANLLGPIVVGAHSLYAKQLVLSDKRYSTRHRLMKLPVRQPVAKTA